jgi:DNA primase
MGSCIDKDPEFIFVCPNEDCDSRKKGKYKMSVNFEKNAFHCWVCELKGSSLAYLAKYLHLDTSIFGEDDLSDEIEHELNEDTNEMPEIRHIVSIPSHFKPIEYEKSKSNNYIQAVKYLYRRGIKPFDITKYRIHYNPGDYQILIPSYDAEGFINTYFVRNIMDSGKFMPPFPKKHVIANELFVDWKEEIVICEGFFDAFTAGDNAIPLLGSYLASDYLLFQRILQYRPKSVILALDKDAFENKTIKIANLFFGHGIVTKIVRFPDDKDINDIGREAFRIMKHKADLYHDLYYMDYELNNM